MQPLLQHAKAYMDNIKQSIVKYIQSKFGYNLQNRRLLGKEVLKTTEFDGVVQYRN